MRALFRDPLSLAPPSQTFGDVGRLTASPSREARCAHTASRATTVLRGMAVEKMNGRAKLMRKLRTVLEQRRMAPLAPAPLPNVMRRTVTRPAPASPSACTMPRPPAPYTPVVCASSTTTHCRARGTYVSNTSSRAGRGAKSPSIE